MATTSTNATASKAAAKAAPQAAKKVPSQAKASRAIPNQKPMPTSMPAPQNMPASPAARPDIAFLKGMKAGQTAQTAMKMGQRPGGPKIDLAGVLAKRKLLGSGKKPLGVSSSPLTGGSNYNPQQ